MHSAINAADLDALQSPSLPTKSLVAIVELLEAISGVHWYLEKLCLAKMNRIHRFLNTLFQQYHRRKQET